MHLDQWAKRWSVPNAALFELRMILGVAGIDDPASVKEISEAGVQSRVRLEASRKGCRLWRNNVGAVYTADGTFMRYGLANDSMTVNRKIKSADLIGIRPIVITEDLVGCVIGQFVSREIKSSKWRYTGNDREQAQLRWAELILALGGDACFAVGEGTL